MRNTKVPNGSTTAPQNTSASQYGALNNVVRFFTINSVLRDTRQRANRAVENADKILEESKKVSQSMPNLGGSTELY